MQKEKSDSPELDYIKKEIQVLNERLTVLESSLLKLQGQNISGNNVESAQKETEFEFKLPFQSEGGIEFRVGEYGMAWLGNIVLFFGIAFLVGYFQNSGFEIFSVAAGYIAVAGIEIVETVLFVLLVSRLYWAAVNAFILSEIFAPRFLA